MLRQIYADVTGREMAVSGEEQASALGAAMPGAVAAGTAREGGGYDSLADAVARMAPPPARACRLIDANRAPYDALYPKYCRLYGYFGRGESEVMKTPRHPHRKE